MMKKREILCTTVASVIVLGLLLLTPMSSINCSGNTCSLKQRLGIFGIKKSQKSFNRNDIVKYHLQDFRHTDIARYIHSSHTDYVPVLEMKDGSAIILPFSFCREPYKAEELVSKVKSDKDFSKKTMFGF